MSAPLLEVKDLRVAFDTDEGTLRAVAGVSFEVGVGETLGIVGESGCGKSVSALSLMRLVPTPPGRIEGGSIHFDGRDILELSKREMRELRGSEIAMIFQEPMTSLNPVYTIGAQIIEVICLHQKASKREARERALELLQLVGIPAPESRIDSYPHTLSGGMRQRAMIAMALACQPRLLIADEPTTALDVTIQAQILELLKSLQSRFGMSIILISHDLGVVAQFADRIAVMYAGKIVEYADVGALFREPKHPYTRGLLRSLPSYRSEGVQEGRLQTIPGVVPDLRSLPSGCRFKARCELRFDRCEHEEPRLAHKGDRLVACYRVGEEA